ncbi:MAG: N-acetyltransferase [Clostridiales bacterium]|nr:N-acetyltransferase [Clostridiales bacterium]
MDYSIVEVKSKKQLKEFADFPNKLYKDNNCYIPGLLSDDIATFDPDKNPAFEYCNAKYWLAKDNNGHTVGRIAAIINHKHIEKFHENTGRFGFIDFIEDYEVAKLLLDTACNWLKQNGMDSVIGPLGFCDMDPEGMLIQGFDEEGTLTTIYNHPYYPEYVEKYGFTKDVDWLEYRMTVDTIPDTLRQISQRALTKYNLRVYQARSLNELKEKYGQSIFALLNEAYENLYAVVPLTQKQIDAFISQYIELLTLDYIRLIIDENDELISFGIGMPSLSEPLKKYRGRLNIFSALPLLRALKSKHPKTIDLLLIATREDYQRRGVNATLLCEMFDFAKSRGVQSFNMNPQLETNIKVRNSFKYFNVTNNKTRRSYVLKLNQQDQRSTK